MLSVFRGGKVKKYFFFARANGEVVLGGTGYHNNFDLRVSADDTRHILEATSQLIPSLKVSKISFDHRTFATCSVHFSQKHLLFTSCPKLDDSLFQIPIRSGTPKYFVGKPITTWYPPLPLCYY